MLGIGVEQDHLHLVAVAGVDQPGGVDDGQRRAAGPGRCGAARSRRDPRGWPRATPGRHQRPAPGRRPRPRPPCASRSRPASPRRAYVGRGRSGSRSRTAAAARRRGYGPATAARPPAAARPQPEVGSVPGRMWSPSLASAALFLVGWSCGWFLLWRPRPLPAATRTDGADGRGRRWRSSSPPATRRPRCRRPARQPLPQLREGDVCLVVDDESSDGTAAVAAAGGADVVRSAAPRPEGWTGKAWACAAGADAPAQLRR